MYYAVVLTEESRKKLIKYFNLDSDTKYAHHCTMLYFPEVLKELVKNNSVGKFAEEHLGCKINLTVDEYIETSSIIACGVSGVLSINENPHITLYVAEGHKPVESNFLDWDNSSIPLQNPLELEGYITLCK